VLLGDKDQLASVEAGAVLGDLCRDAVAGRYDAATRAHLAASAGVQLPAEYADDAGPRLAQHTVMLRESRRFGGAIGQLAQAVNAGDRAAVQALLATRAQAEDPAIRALQGGQPEACCHWPARAGMAPRGLWRLCGPAEGTPRAR
jgi:exodeoxyribonuclease V alpha subunit